MIFQKEAVTQLFHFLYTQFVPASAWYCTFSFPEPTILQALVVQRLDNAIHRINHYPVDSVVCFVNAYRWIVIYPMDSVIQPLNNRGLACIDRELWPGPTPESMIHRLSLKSGKSDWLRIRNEYSGHTVYSENRVRPELSIPAKGLKDRGLWGQEWVLQIYR